MRLLLVAHDELIRQGLKTLLQPAADIDIVGEIKGSQDAATQARALQPDVTLVHTLSTDDDALATARAVKQESPPSRVLFVTQCCDHEHFQRAMAAGASGYELMDISPAHLANAIRAVFNGNTAINQNVLKHIAHALSQNGHRPTAEAPPPHTLTPRGLMVLTKLAQGLSDKEIAAALLCSEATVKSHLRSIYSKLRINNRAQAAAYAVKHGLTRPQ
jgi:DNA-binding NarL/FixJ family response regulator